MLLFSMPLKAAAAVQHASVLLVTIQGQHWPSKFVVESLKSLHMQITM